MDDDCRSVALEGSLRGHLEKTLILRRDVREGREDRHTEVATGQNANRVPRQPNSGVAGQETVLKKSTCHVNGSRHGEADTVLKTTTTPLKSCPDWQTSA
jgi:hypothetical protein